MISFIKGGRDLNPNPYTAKQHGSNNAQIKSNDYDKIEIMDSEGEFKEIPKNNLANYLQEVLINKYINNQLKYRAGISK